VERPTVLCSNEAKIEAVLSTSDSDDVNSASNTEECDSVYSASDHVNDVNDKFEKRKGRRRRRRRGSGKPTTSTVGNCLSACSDLDENDENTSGSSDLLPQHKIEVSKKEVKHSRKPRKRNRNKEIKNDRNRLLFHDDLPKDVKGQYVAMDCEMVGIGPNGSDSALARVSIVDWYGEVIFDSFVRVKENVTDYRTCVSGITPDKIESDDVLSFDNCNEEVSRVLKDKILIGHGLKNDLKVLRIQHPWYKIRDSARYEPLMKADIQCDGVLIPRKLKDLARENAKLNIQKDGKHHCSIEDARASMMIYRVRRVKWEKTVEWKMKKTESMTYVTSDSSVC